ncbi:MAG: hypothetical protein KDD89_12955, partial [Anaerolineales bacterium]|nr:hypothetical protein [Anaerolineales bacterium]
MSRKVINTGIIFGLLISLAALYPAISLVAPLSVEGLLRPIQSELWHGIALMVSAAFVLALTTSFGHVAARRGRADSIHTGAKMGAFAGLIVGFLTFVTIVSPLVALFAYDQIAAFPPGPGMIFPPATNLNEYIDRMVYNPTMALVMVLGFHAFLGAVMGALAIWRNPPIENDRLPLTEHLNTQKNPRSWLPEDRQAVGVAILTGLIFGAVFTFLEAQFFTDLTNMITNMPTEVFNTRSIESRMPGSVFVTTVFPTLALLALGGVVVYFMHNPTHRLRTRVGAVVLATVTTIVPLVAINLRYILLWLGLAPYLAYYAIEEWLSMPVALDEITVEESVMYATQLQTFLATQVADAKFFGTAAFVVPWIVLFGFTIGMVVVGVLEGMFFGLVMPMFRPAPIDKAARLRRKLSRDPA